MNKIPLLSLASCFFLGATSLLSGQIYHNIGVSTYGAHPNDGLDDIAGIRAAIASIPKNSNYVNLIFGPGTCDLHARTILGLPRVGAVTIAGRWYKEVNGQHSWTYGGQGCVDDVLIEGCNFQNIGGAGVTGRSSNSVEIRYCTFDRMGFLGSLFATSPEARFAVESLLYFTETGSVKIENNTASDYQFADRWWTGGFKPNPYVLNGNSWQQ